MGINERRTREREQRRRAILQSAWQVAEDVGWAGFSVERVAEKAELGRATVYGYFDSLEALVSSMADEALEMLASRVSEKDDLAVALDAPLRFSQAHHAAFALLFQELVDPRPAFAKANLERARGEAHQMVSALRRLAARQRAVLPSDAAAADAFLSAIAMAGTLVPELRDHTPLRRRWQDFCLELGRKPLSVASGPPETNATPTQESSTEVKRARSRG
jgi:AcrR family transcriptional regulator